MIMRCASLCLLCCAAAFAGEAIQKGDSVQVKTANAPVQMGETVLAQLAAGAVLKVTDVRGDWVGVDVTVGGETKGGWIQASHVQRVVPGGQAAPQAPGTAKVGEIRRFVGPRDVTLDIAFSLDGGRALSGGADRTLSLWDVAAGKEIHRLRGHSGAVTTVAFSPDGLLGLSGSRDGTVRIWDLKTGREVRKLRGATGAIACVAFSADGQRIISVGEYLLTWQRQGYTRLQRVRVGAVGGRGAISRDGRYIVCATDLPTQGRGPGLWDAHTGRLVGGFPGHSGAVGDVAFSPDGRTVVTVGGGGLVHLWNLTSRNEVRRLRGHTGQVTCVAFTPDGTRVLTGGEDHSVRVWEVGTGRQLGLLRGHAAPLTVVVPSPDGRFALTASMDRSIRLWGLPK